MVRFGQITCSGFNTMHIYTKTATARSLCVEKSSAATCMNQAPCAHTNLAGVDEFMWCGEQISNFANSGQWPMWAAIGGQMPLQNFLSIGYGPSRQHVSFRARLSIISNHVMTQLYMPNLSGSWAAIQKKIAGLNIQLLEWEKSLPEELNLRSTMAIGIDPRAKIDLALYHQSIRMILYQPCLCHIRIPNESVYSKEFNLSGVRNCVLAAVSLIDILPEDPSAHEAYQLLP